VPVRPKIAGNFPFSISIPAAPRSGTGAEFDFRAPFCDSPQRETVEDQVAKISSSFLCPNSIRSLTLDPANELRDQLLDISDPLFR
jgi:hypothetical protein